jgi:hypothetical protein
VSDRDTTLSAVLDRLTPARPAHDDWTEIVRRAAEASPSAVGWGLRRTFFVAGAAVAVAAAVALFVTVPWRGGPDVVSRAEAALAIPSGSVLHLKFTDTYRNNLGTVTETPFELWISSRGRYRGFTIDPDSGVRVEIAGSRSLRDSVQYDPALNAIGPGLVTNMYYLFGDPVDTLRRELAQGRATADGRATIQGQTTTRIRLALTGADCKPVTDYLFVSPRTFRPIEYRVIVFLPNRATLTRRYGTYELLPATAANLRQTNIEAVHPSAKVYPRTPYRGGGPPCASPPRP